MDEDATIGALGKVDRDDTFAHVTGGIAITTLGTRGDVQPYIALARGLIAKGHHVTLLAPEQFADLVAEHGVPCCPLPGDILNLIDTPEAKKAVSSSEGFGAGLKLLKQMRPLAEKLLNAEWAALSALRPSLIVYHPKSFGAPHMAQALGCETILAPPLPGFTATSAFPSPLLPFESLGPLNKISHLLGTHSARFIFGSFVRRWRRETLGLEARGSGVVPVGTLYAYSPSVLPKPNDWGADVLVGGYWFLDTPDWQMPPDLSAFLQKGAAPVYVGFGSMPGLDPYRVTAIIIEALEKSGKRGLLATVGGAIAERDVPDTIKIISGAPHDHLFKHVAATVHHGGA